MKKRDLFKNDSEEIELEKFTKKIERVIRQNAFNESPETLSEKIKEVQREFSHIKNRRLMNLITHGAIITIKDLIISEIKERIK